MTNKIEAIDLILKKLDTDIILPHQACSIANDIYLLMLQDELDKDMQVLMLASHFISLLPKWGLDDLLVRQVNYAIRIAKSKGALLYEEMHKLFSLCNEIYSLEYLGLYFDTDLKQQYEKSIRDRFKRDKTKAKLVAEDMLEEWNKEIWWYKENIG